MDEFHGVLAMKLAGRRSISYARFSSRDLALHWMRSAMSAGLLIQVPTSAAVFERGRMFASLGDSRVWGAEPHASRRHQSKR
jgi:hypothetical protein